MMRRSVGRRFFYRSELVMALQPVFIQVGELADGFAPASHILPALDDLVRKTLRLEFADDSALELRFLTADVLRSRVVGGSRRAQSAQVANIAIGPRRFAMAFIWSISWALRV